MDQANVPTDRRTRRSNVFLMATLEVSGAAIPVKIRNLSAEGALIEGDGIPVEGTALRFRRNELAVPARVAWLKGTRGGIAFDETLPPEEVLRHVPAPKPRQDNGFRRPGLVSRPLTAAEMKVAQQWAIRTAKDRLGD